MLKVAVLSVFHQNIAIYLQPNFIIYLLKKYIGKFECGLSKFAFLQDCF